MEELLAYVMDHLLPDSFDVLGVKTEKQGKDQLLFPDYDVQMRVNIGSGCNHVPDGKRL